MVVAIFCGHPDNLEDSDEPEQRTVARESNTEPIASTLQRLKAVP